MGSTQVKRSSEPSDAVPLHRVSPFALIVILKFTPLFNFVSYEEVRTCFYENDCPLKNWEDRYSYSVNGQLKHSWFSAEPRKLFAP